MLVMHLFGYKKNKEIVGKLDIDEDSANIVKYIFKLFLEGKGTSSIAKILTDEKVPTPAMYLNMNVDKNSIFYTVWKPNSVRNILRNETYLGYMIQNKETTISHKNSKRIYLDQNDYIKIPNHHLPIISKEDFEMANKILDSKKRNSNIIKEKTILHNFLYCNECNKKLARRDYNGRIYYYCRTRTVFHLCNNNIFLSYSNIEKEVFTYIKKILKKYSDKELLRQAFINEYSSNKTKINEYNVTQNKLSNELLKINNKIDILYNDKLNNVITADMYKKYSLNLKEEQKILQNKINDIKIILDVEKDKLQSLKNNEDIINKLINRFCNLKNINSEIVNEFIEKISIDENRDFNIKLKFNL